MDAQLLKKNFASDPSEDNNSKMINNLQVEDIAFILIFLCKY